MIRRLKEENTTLAKEESKAKSTDPSDSPEAAGMEALLSQLHNNPQLRAALISHIQNEEPSEGEKKIVKKMNV